MSTETDTGAHNSAQEMQNFLLNYPVAPTGFISYFFLSISFAKMGLKKVLIFCNLIMKSKINLEYS